MPWEEVINESLCRVKTNSMRAALHTGIIHPWYCSVPTAENEAKY